MKLNQPAPGRTLTRAILARFFKRSIRTIDRWGIARSELLTAKEAQARLGVNERMFFRLIDGDLDFPRPIRIGAPLWRADDLDYYKAHRRQTNQPKQLSLI